MADHPNAVRARQAVESLTAGDMEHFLSTLDEDITWRVGGRSALSGIYRGREQVGRWFGRVRELTDGTHRVEPLEVLANDQHLALFLRITARVNEETLDMKIANAFRIGPDGRWKDSWFLSDDQTAMDGAGFRILVPEFLGGRSPGPRRG